MKIAVIGSGISGLTCAYLLNKSHDVHLFEKRDRLGGHTATIDIEHRGQGLSIDTGFIVFNDWTYPNFIKLINELGVDSQPTEMGFSVQCDQTGLEYAGNNMASLFAQKRNLLNPRHLRMLTDIVRFNREAVLHLERGQIAQDMTVGEYLTKFGYSKRFASHYLVPMASAIWSASLQKVRDFPLLFFVQFFKNHGLLSINDRPQWRVIKGGSRRYIEPLSRGLETHLSADIKHVRRDERGAWLHFGDGSRELFEQVVFAIHSDQALDLLDDPSQQEREILTAMPYEDNSVVLHTDERLLPKRKKAWASWNYRLREEDQSQAVLTYNMNILQGIASDATYCVTVNANDLIDPSKVFGRYTYAHPQFSLDFVAAQQRWEEINGTNHTWYCGAYWANGFHEDGCLSGVRVARALGIDW